MGGWPGIPGRIRSECVGGRHRYRWADHPGIRKVLDIDWLARVGAGLELDISGTNIGLISRARATVYYVFGEDYNGVALGLGVSF